MFALTTSPMRVTNLNSAHPKARRHRIRAEPELLAHLHERKFGQIQPYHRVDVFWRRRLMTHGDSGFLQPL